MGKVRWYKRDPNAALEGMACLTLEERGAYNTILDLIYSHDGKVDDDDRFLAGWLRVDVRVWRRIRTRLLELEKLYVNGSTLRNARADREVDEALARCLSAAQAGLTSAANRQGRLNLINGLASTPVQRTSQLSTLRKKVSKKASFSFLPSEQVAARARAKKSSPTKTEAAEGPQADFRGKQASEVSRAELAAIYQHKHGKH